MAPLSQEGASIRRDRRYVFRETVLLATPAQPGHDESDAHTTRKVSPAAADAMELRGRARVALDAWRPEECLRLLDEAKAKDPKGDEAEDVVAMRETAEQRMQVGPKPKG